MNDVQELILDHNQRPYGMFAQGDMYEIIENYKASNIDVFNKAEIIDLETLNDKNKFTLTPLTEDGTKASKLNLNFGRCSVGLHSRVKKQFKNSLKVIPIKILNIVWDTKERITAKMPVGFIKPGQQIEIEFDWKPLIGNRKSLDCMGLIQIEPEFSKRMEQSIYP